MKKIFKGIKRSDLFLILAFLLIITVPLLWFPIKHVLITTGLSSMTITDNWQFYDKNKTGIIGRYEDLVEGTKIDITNRVNNYFPFFTELTTTYYAANYGLNSMIYNDNIIVGKNNDGESIIYNKYGFYYVVNKYNDEELNDRYEKQVDFFKTLADTTDLNLYIYLPLRYDLTNLESRGLEKYVASFVNDIDNSYKVGTLNIQNIDMYKEYYYKTDHHWNGKGALAGYYDIVELMNLEDKTEYVVSEKVDVEYYGSMAKSIMSDRIVDNFYVINNPYGFNVVNISTGQDYNFKPQTIKETNNKYYDYYVGYFNGQYGHVTYRENTNSNKNLLIFSDSYSWQIDHLIAKSFNETHVINLRYNEYTNSTFDLKSYIKENNITDILFLYEGVSTLFDQYNYNFAERIVY